MKRAKPWCPGTYLQLLELAFWAGQTRTMSFPLNVLVLLQTLILLDRKLFEGRDDILAILFSQYLTWDRSSITICWVNEWLSSGRLLGLGSHVHNRDVNCFLHWTKSTTAKTSRTYYLSGEHFTVRLFTLPSYLCWNKIKTGYLVLQVNICCVRILSPY